MLHFLYGDSPRTPLCQTQAATGVLRANGLSANRLPATQKVTAAYDVDCPLCLATYLLWVPNAAFTDALYTLTEPEREALAFLRDKVENLPPNHPQQQIASRLFRLMLQRYEAKANRWVLCMRLRPILA